MPFLISAGLTHIGRTAAFVGKRYHYALLSLRLEGKEAGMERVFAVKTGGKKKLTISACQVIIRTTMQWFADVGRLQEKAIEEISKVSMVRTSTEQIETTAFLSLLLDSSSVDDAPELYAEVKAALVHIEAATVGTSHTGLLLEGGHACGASYHKR